jgi:ABC-type branched-subunit amino acid transport system ATPase component
MAGGFQIMLLDEPSSGLDKVETRRFGEILRSLIDDLGIGILIVEHDMSLVMSVCDYIHVLDFGKPIFEGTAHEVGTSDLVRAAYLGSEAVEEALV